MANALRNTVARSLRGLESTSLPGIVNLSPSLFQPSMSVELYVHPNTSQPQPKIWGYENGSINTVFFGKLTDSWNVQEKAPNYGRNKASNKMRDGYLHVGTFQSMTEAEGFRTAYQSARQNQRYRYDASNAVQRSFAQALSQLNLPVQAISAAPVQPAPAQASSPTVTAAPKAAQKPAPASVKKPIAIDWSQGDDAICLL